jgi:uncharacterized membrane protein YidH (DUF202 family)
MSWLSSLVSERCRSAAFAENANHCSKLNQYIILGALSALLAVNFYIHWRQMDPKTTDQMARTAIVVNTVVALIVIWVFIPMAFGSPSA